MADDVLRKVAGEGLEKLQSGRKLVEEFKSFILQGNALDLAVGVVIGAAFNTVVQSLVKDLLTPIISLPGSVDLTRLQLCLKSGVVKGVETCQLAFAYGSFLTTVISFLLTAAAVFFFVVRPMNQLRERRKAGAPEEQATRECPECLSKIPVAAKRCAYCTTKVGTTAA
jgi:large conductance mechanosensitive channel